MAVLDPVYGDDHSPRHCISVHRFSFDTGSNIYRKGNKMNIVQAWKDSEYRSTLSADELAELPDNPAGTIELTDDELGMAWGGGSNVVYRWKKNQTSGDDKPKGNTPPSTWRTPRQRPSTGKRGGRR